MDRKIGVGETIGFCAGYARRNIGLLLRLAWPPILLSVGGTVLILMGLGLGDVVTAVRSGADPYRDANPGLVALGYLLSVLGTLALVPAYVVITRHAAGAYEPPRGLFAGFRFGGREARVIGAAILWFLLLMGVYFGISLAGGAVTLGLMAVAMTGDATGGAFVVAMVVSFLVTLATLGFVVFFLVRSMLFIPMAATENRIALADAWRATRGNFWRLFAIGLLLYLIVFAVYIAFAALAGSLFAVMGGEVGAILIGALGLLAIPAYLFVYLLFLAFPGRAAGALRPLTRNQAAEVFD